MSQLEVLVAIVDAGNLSEAAEVVSLTQSAVSYSLSRLETELGVTLLERGRQGIALTRIGEEIVQHARSILGQIEIIRQKTAREQGFNTGKLRFGCVPTIPARLLTGILRNFQNKYPDIDIVVFEGSPLELVEWLGSEVIDIGTVTAPEGYLLSLPFVHTELNALISERHLLATENEIPMESLINEAFIGPKAEYGILHHLIRQQSLSLPRLRYAVSTQSTILTMVRENMGVALMLDILIDPRIEGIVARPLVPRLFVDIYLSTHIKSPVVDAFMTNASSWAKEHNFWLDVP
ncbi:MAG: LysR family transcriptional regulator [Anaerolineae bacterium]|nr:LysR family transcriptional regulator [Anaerolineae bacterium]